MGQKVPRAPKRESRQVDAAASSVPIGGTNKEHPSFRFAGADPNKFCLHEWGTTEIEQFVRSLAKIERFTWQQIIASGGQGYSSGGPGYKPIPSYELPALPQQVPLDVKARATARAYRHLGAPYLEVSYGPTPTTTRSRPTVPATGPRRGCPPSSSAPAGTRSREPAASGPRRCPAAPPPPPRSRSAAGRSP